ncbi:extracellular solute-binding protein [Nonomuraea terrae]|uniref:Extracellular solute-binding protein n=1 Tax=Nonomuraea terrae TaxID=2530383 RepID=A0A4R4YE49_9ACTN|nr:extracellular solute-binding protein [Nonomuraea terrae]TDD42876.1 extracellular solute-binding protein [Nonomuraea terrae]
MDLAALAAENHLAHLTPLFDAPSIDDPARRVRDTITPAVIDNAKIDGKDLVLNYTVSHRALWYDAALFASMGWAVPTTWAEFTALGEQAKKEGIALFAYPGQKGPYYQLWNLLYTAAKIGGNQVIIDIDNLAEGAWNAEPVKQAVTAWTEIQAKYGEKSHFGLDHTQTQIKHLRNEVLFYPVGSWIENEMAKDKPAGLMSAARAQDSAGANIITEARFEGWYKELFDYGTAQTNAVMAGRITPERFCADLQEKADAIKNDASVPKQTRSR